jgi:hypothetical protein
LALALLSTAACTSPPARHEHAAPPVSVSTRALENLRVLAGEWDYEDGGVVTLTLDEQGNGTILGRTVTLSRTLCPITSGGIWVQKENDREGGFSLRFSPDFSGRRPLVVHQDRR